MLSIRPIKAQVDKPINYLYNQARLELFAETVTNPTSRAIVIRLRELKKNQEWLADSVGVSKMAVTKWVHAGKISRLNLPVVAKVLGLTLGQLTGAELYNPAQVITMQVSPEEERLVSLFRLSSNEGRRMLILTAEIAGKSSVSAARTN